MENVFNQSIWGDEGFSAILSMKPIPDILTTISRDTSPPLWNLFEYFAFQTFGASETTIRGLSLTFFLLAIFFTYKIGSLLWNKRTGFLGALLTTFNPFFFTYAFEGRMYSILALGVTASMYFYLKILRTDEVKPWMRIGYIIATTWALYSHHFAIFALFIQGLWFSYEFIFGARKRAIVIFKSMLIVGILYIPWLMPLYNQTKMVGGGFWLGTPTLYELRNLIYEYLAEGIKNSDLKVPYFSETFYHLALYVTFAVLVFRNWTKSIKKTIFLTLWFLGPIGLTWAVSQKFQSIFFNRYLLYAIPAAMLILASNARKVSYAVIILLLSMFIVIDKNYFENPAKLPFKTLSAYVLQTKGKNDILINWNGSAHHLWETKFYNIPAPIYIPKGGDLPYFVGTALMEDSDIIQKIPENTYRVGVITSGPIDEVNISGYTESEAKTFKPKSGGRELHFIWYEKTAQFH